MKKIKVDNAEAVKAALDAVQARARVRTIDADAVQEMCKAVSDRLSIPKKHLDGVRFSADYHAQAFPGAYNGRPESTIISCEYKRGAWYLTDAYRGDCRRPSVAYSVDLTDAAKAAILDSKMCF